MSIPGAASPLFIGAAVAEEAGFQIDRSLRFNSGDSADLSKTFSSAGNRKTWTWSCWYKRSVLGTKNQRFFSCLTGSDDNTYLELRSFDNDTICLSGYATNFRVTDAEIRDPSAWYHLVVACDTTQGSNSDRIKLYINGVQQTFRTETTITQNADLGFNQAAAHKIGNAFDGYLAEIHFVDGSQLAASDFGEYDSNNNWNPKDCQSSLTYGTNGFYLKFADNSSASALGTDAAGSNDWTVNNISVASGSGNDSLIDTPTNYTAASGNNGGNYCTLNSVETGDYSTLSNGNLDQTGGATDYSGKRGTFSMTTGKWYWEVTINGTSGVAPGPGIQATNVPNYESPVSTRRTYYNTGQKFDGSLSSYGSSFTTGDIIGVAFDADTGSLTFYKNGTSQGVAFSSLSDGPYSPLTADYNGSSTSHNFGQRPFAYTPPTGYLSLCTENLPDPTIADGSTAMNATTYTGNGSTQAVTGLNHSPDLAWIKHRTRSQSHVIYDIVRGAGTGKSLSSNSSGVEGGAGDGTVYGYLSAFGSDGFTVIDGSDAEDYVNKSGAPYIAWTWDGGSSTSSNSDGSITTNVRANVSAGFSIIGYTGNATVGATIGHGLNSAPEWLVFKNREEGAGNWYVYHKSTGHTKYLTLDRTHGATTHGFLNNTAPTNSVVTLNNTAEVNATGQDIICYAWTSVSGYSSFGSYVGSQNFPFVYCGFRPRYLLIKPTNLASGWQVYDSERSQFNVADKYLAPNAADAEVTSTNNNQFDFLSNGFVPRGVADSGSNYTGYNFLYCAFAEHPFKTSRAK